MEVERIKFERTGGFAGIRFAADFALNDLSDEQARELTELIDDLDFEKLPERMTSEPSSSDEFTYTVQVETKKWAHTVVTGEATSNGKMQSLLDLLTQIARKQMRKP